jgi:mycothiol synthase
VQDARVETTPGLTVEQADAVRGLIAAVTAADGARPVSDHTMLRLRHSPGGDQHLLLWSGSDVVGYAHLDGGNRPEAELAVAPEARTSGADRLLLDEVRRAAAGPIQVWAHGERSGLLDLFRSAGLRPDRVLFQLRRPLTGPDAEPLPEPEWPDGVTVRTFVPRQDETAWLEVNNRAFADHPDQSGWTVDDVTEREAEDWFDPAGFFLAETDGRVVGFHWTKVHPASATDEALGEVYVIGIDPSMRGRRLGPALTLHGLQHLRAAGLDTAMLYVDETNEVGVRLYERLGFTRHHADIRFVGGPPG